MVIVALSNCANESVSSVGENSVRAPFDFAAIRSEKGRADNAAFRCEAAPKSLRDLQFDSIYGNLSENSSVVDPDSYKKYKAETVSMSSFESKVTAMANRYVQSNPRRPEIAQCAMKWIRGWAKEDALLGDANRTGEFVRKGVFASVVLTYQQVKDEPTLRSQDKRRIEKWIRQVAERIVADFSKNTDIKSRQNNHLYWAAWSVAGAAIVLDDRELLGWAMEKARYGINQIEKDGTMPHEMARGQMAFNYHLYAAVPLFMLAETARYNGVDLFSENKKGLKRLGKKLLRNADNPADFKKQTGQQQIMNNVAVNMTWLEIYHMHYPDNRTARLLKRYRPLKQSRVGGDATFLYGDAIK